MTQISEKIRMYIAENILFSNNGYPDEGIIDSMNVLELVAFVEENFGIAVEDHEIVPDNFDSVSRIATFVDTRAA